MTDWMQLESQVFMRAYKRVPRVLERGVGCRVWDTEGREYLDLVGGWAVASLGHSPPTVVSALHEQAQKLIQVSNQFYSIPQLELAQILVEHTPWRVFGAQATGCSPVSAAFAAGHDVVRPVRPDTIAKSLAIGNPADGPYVLDVVRRTGGVVADVSDDEIVDSIRLLAGCEGIFGETAGGVTLGVLRKLLIQGQLDPAAETVIINSGDGLKTLDAISEAIDLPDPIRPTLEAFQEAMS